MVTENSVVSGNVLPHIRINLASLAETRSSSGKGRIVCFVDQKAGAAETCISLTQSEAVSYGLALQTGAIVVSALGVILTVLWNRRIAKRRATLDLVLAEETDPAMVSKRNEFVRLRDDGHLAQWADPQKTSSEQAGSIRAMLNRYELIAIGIRQKTIDEKMYKKWCRTTLVKEWTACKPFIMQLRQNTNTPTYFCEFEALAKRWANKSEKSYI